MFASGTRGRHGLSARLALDGEPRDPQRWQHLYRAARQRDGARPEREIAHLRANLPAGQSADVDGEVKGDGARSVEVEPESGEGGGSGGGTSGSGHNSEGGEGSKDGGSTSGSGGDGGGVRGKVALTTKSAGGAVRDSKSVSFCLASAMTRRGDGEVRVLPGCL